MTIVSEKYTITSSDKLIN